MNGTGKRETRGVTLRKVLFPLLVLFAFITSQISPAYIAFGLLVLLWIVAMWREGVRRT